MTDAGGSEASKEPADIVQRIQKGDTSAFHELVERYAQYLYGVARSLVGNPADAEDVLQETYTGALKGCRSFRGNSSVKTWLTQILVRQAAGYYRKKARRKVVPIDVDIEENRLQHTVSSDSRMDVSEAIDALSPNHREVIIFREIKGMSYDQIAEVLDIPRGTVESRLFRARGELKNLLKEYL